MKDGERERESSKILCQKSEWSDEVDLQSAAEGRQTVP